VAFVGINSNKQEDVSEIKEHAAEHGFKFTLLKDPGNVVADAYDAKVTPEVFVIAADGTVRYHGRIDDNKDGSEVTSQDLRAALDALLAGKEPARAATKAFGCTIKRVKKDS
jgi:peroxiredoxin